MNSQEEWEKRARKFRNNINGVLFENLPEFVNELISSWHQWVVSAILIDTLPKGAVILDAGCGFGRISMEIKKLRQDVRVVGVDFSETYCALYHENVGEAVSCRIEQLPFKNEVFDAVISVTTLMYADSLSSGVDEIYRVTKPNGIAVFIDPGREIFELIGMVRKKRSLTGGKGFYRKEYIDAVKDSGFKVYKKGGNMFFTIFLIFLSASGLISTRFSKGVLQKMFMLDQNFFSHNRASIHKWVAAKKQECQK